MAPKAAHQGVPLKYLVFSKLLSARTTSSACPPCGLTPKGDFKSERENVDEDILELGHGPHAVEIDIMQPIDPAKKPRVDEPALNHIGLWVDDLQTAVSYLTEKGMRFTPGGIRKGAAGYDVCFIHPKGNDEFPLCGEGVLIELIQAPDEIKKALG